MRNRVNRLPGIPRRAPDAHKGQFGRVLIVAGSPGMTGAACMAALAAQRAGAGTVTLALPESLNPVAEVKLTSAMSRPLPEGEGGVIAEEAARRVLDWSGQFDIYAVGPGLGRRDETQRAVRRLVRAVGAPLVLDADGLNALAGSLEALDGAPGPRLLTPHPGEMARLVGLPDGRAVQGDREALAVEFARRHGVLVALKGAGTVVTDGERVFINPSGNPGMACGGMGDLLTGLAAGLLGQGLEPFEALQMAVFVHGLAGDMAARLKGELSLVPEDVLECLPEAFMRVEAAGAGSDAEELAASLRG